MSNTWQSNPSQSESAFRFANGNLFIQDMSSRIGMFVNDAKTDATTQSNDDRIRIGSSPFEFHSTGLIWQI